MIDLPFYQQRFFRFGASRLFALSALFAVATNAGIGQETAPGATTVLVEKAVAIPDTVNKKYIGLVESIDSVAVQPRVSGNIMATHFTEGEVVKKGQPLFDIEDTLYKARVQNAKALIAQIDAKLGYARSSYERYSNLVKKDSVSQDTVDNVKTNLKSLEAEKMAAEAELVIAEDNLHYTRITAPIAGRVGRVTYSTGNYITPQSGALLTITRIDDVYVRFPLSARDLFSLFGNGSNMREHAVITLTLADGKPYELKGDVVMVDNLIKSTTDTVNVWARFANPDEKLIAGGIVTVHLSKKDKEEFPGVTISAVMHEELKSYVYVLNDKNEVERRDVTLGNMIDQKQLLRSGIKEGDVVIIDGMHKTAPGSVVTPVYSKN